MQQFALSRIIAADCITKQKDVHFCFIMPKPKNQNSREVIDFCRIDQAMLELFALNHAAILKTTKTL